jgi:hypothetical protein
VVVCFKERCTYTSGENGRVNIRLFSIKECHNSAPDLARISRQSSPQNLHFWGIVLSESRPSFNLINSHHACPPMRPVIQRSFKAPCNTQCHDNQFKIYTFYHRTFFCLVTGAKGWPWLTRRSRSGSNDPRMEVGGKANKREGPFRPRRGGCSSI